MADDNDRRGAIVAGATAALIGGLGVFFGANGQEAKLPTPVAVDTTQTTPTDVTIPSVDDLAAAVTDCQNLPTGSQERIDCGRGLVDGAKGALVDALATNADQADIESLWADSAKAIALGRNPYDVYAGVDVQGLGYNRNVAWDTIFPEALPHVTSLGFYGTEWPYSSSVDHADYLARANRLRARPEP